MPSSRYLHKSHNVSILVYDLVTRAKYRRVIFDPEVEDYLKEICQDIEKRYEVIFLEIGVDQDPVHFLIQSVPMYSPQKLVQIIKSITGRDMFIKFPALKEKLWGTEFWTKGYFISSVGKQGDEKKLINYDKSTRPQATEFSE
jgi:putative transposase